MKVSEYVGFEAVGLAELVAKGEVLPAELEAAAREAVQAVDPQINAVVETWLTDDEPVPGSTPLAGCPFSDQRHRGGHGREADGAGKPPGGR